MDALSCVVLLAMAVAVSAYLLMAGSFATGMIRAPKRVAKRPEVAPPVTILKPLAGNDDDLMENLESFAAIDYPAFSLLLGVASVSDPAYTVANAFLARHPGLDARVVLTDPSVAMNPKVAQLICLERQTKTEIIVISDSNIRVSPSYLWSMMSELVQPGVGLVTSVFAGTGERTVGAALENLQLGTVTAPGVVASALLSKRPFTVGKSMAMHRADLAAIGGFERFERILAEDHVMGRVFLDAGYRVGTSLEIVENRNIDCTFGRTIERHTRWAKIRRALFPGGFYFEPLLSPLMTATLLVVFAPSKLTAACLAASALLQIAVGTLTLRILRGHSLAWYYAPLELVRVYVSFFCWARACVSRRLSWRGHAFLVKRETVIVPAPPSSWARFRAAVRA